jgi:hypothetical protein
MAVTIPASSQKEKEKEKEKESSLTGNVAWYRDLVNFITRDNFLVFFPTSDMGTIAKMNAIMRLTIYFSIITMLATRDIRVLYILVVIGILTVGIIEMDTGTNIKKREAFERRGYGVDKRSGKICKAPAENNPFMNVLMHEYAQDPQRADACDVENESVKERMKNLFDKDVIRDIDDIFHKKASDRQFYTTANTGIPNDQSGFANWLYKIDNKTCKEGNGVNCYSTQFKHYDL